MSQNNNTQISNMQNFKNKNIIFSEPIMGSIPDSKPKIEFKRINISIKNEDGSIGELILPTSRCFSFGVSENRSQETGKVNGYTFPIVLWGRDGPSPEEKMFTDVFNEVVDTCINHLVKNREEIELFELSRSDLTKSKGGLNPLYWKKEKHTVNGKTTIRVVPGSSPTLYTKLIFSKKNDKFLSQFYDEDDNPLNALDLMGKYCYSRSAIKIESIFIGSRVSLQVKLYEAVVEPTSSGIKRLLQRPKVVNSKMIEMNNKITTNENYEGVSNDVSNDESDTESIQGSLSDSDSDEKKPPAPVKNLNVRKKIIRKVKN